MKFRIPDISKFLRRRRAKTSRHVAPAFQPLEGRTMTSVVPHITSIAADNRGQIVLTTDIALKASTVNRNTVLMFTAGKDRKFHTADDVRLTPIAAVKGKQITLSANVTYTTTAYRVALLGAKITDSAGNKLDAEFNGASTPSGNGTAGGNMDVVVKANTGAKVIHFRTYAGNFDVTLSTDSTLATTVANYVKHVNLGDYDYTFAQRRSQTAEGIDIIQAGRYRILPSNNIVANPKRGTVGLVPGTNLAGTIAMARPSGADAAAVEFYFNVTDNPLIDAHGTQHGYTVFGQTDAHGQAILAKINTYKLVNAGGALATLPVHDFDAVVKRKVLNYLTDTIIYYRVAIADAVVSTSSVQSTTF